MSRHTKFQLNRLKHKKVTLERVNQFSTRRELSLCVRSCCTRCIHSLFRTSRLKRRLRIFSYRHFCTIIVPFSARDSNQALANQSALRDRSVVSDLSLATLCPVRKTLSHFDPGVYYTEVYRTDINVVSL